MRIRDRKPREGPRVPRIRRGIAILPSLFTVANMFCGYSSVIAALREDFELAAILLAVAVFLDGLDGRIARMTGTTSEFGIQLDSLTDFLSFGVAPALILYQWGFEGIAAPPLLHRVAWLFPFLLPVAGAVRLARFNVQAHVADKRFFLGLPIPAAAGAAVLPLFYLPRGIPSHWKIAAFCYVVVLSFLMVSHVRYPSLKQVDMKTRRPAASVVFMAAMGILMVLYPKPILLGIALVYAASGPAAWVWSRIRPPHPAPPAQGSSPVTEAPIAP